MVAAPEAPSQTDNSRTFTVAAYNIWSGRNEGLEITLRAMGSLGVNIGFFQETKLMNSIYTRNLSGEELP